MKKLSFVLVATLALGISTKNSFARIPKVDKDDPQSVVTGLVAEKQEQSRWCWAAVTRILMSSKIQNLPSQCEIVSKTTGLDCCSKPDSIACNQANYETKALTAFGYETEVGHAKVDMTKKWNKRTDNLGWYNSVVKNIQNGIPVGITMNNDAGAMYLSAHIVLAYATYKKGNNDYIVIYDPWEGVTKIMDKTFVTGFKAWTSTVTLK